MHRKGLIYKWKFFVDARNPNSDPSKFLAYDSKGESGRFGFCAISRTIDNDWSILDLIDDATHSTRAPKNTVSAIARTAPLMPQRLRCAFELKAPQHQM
jgi:hypothetical protein